MSAPSPHLAASSMAAGSLGSSPPLLTTLTLVAATVTMGLVAGVFANWADTIMPGLRRTDDRTFVGAFQSLDGAIVNPWFMTCFGGALILTGLAAVLHLGTRTRALVPWLATAFALYLIAVVITLAVNVPLNDALRAAGTPDRIGDLALVRARFDEARWSAWHLARTATTTAAFLILTGTLIGHGRLGR